MGPLPQTLLLAALHLEPADAFELQWDAPQECPGAREVRAAFVQHAKDDPAPVHAHGTITRQEDASYVLELELRSASGKETRRIEANTCASLAETAGLLSAVASEPALVPAPSTPAPPPPPPEDPPPQETTPVQASTPPATEPVPTRAPLEPTDRFPLGLVLRIDGEVQALRLLPQIVGGGVLGAFGVRGRNWRAEARAQYFTPQPRNYADLVVGGSFDLWTAGLAGCWEPATGRLSFPLCGGFEAGSLRGETRDLDQPASAGAFYGGATVDGALVFAPTPRVGLRAGVGGVISVRRPRYHVRTRDTLFQAGPGAIRGFFGVEVRFL